jgi:hypothetical protein
VVGEIHVAGVKLVEMETGSEDGRSGLEMVRCALQRRRGLRCFNDVFWRMAGGSTVL